MEVVDILVMYVKVRGRPLLSFLKYRLLILKRSLMSRKLNNQQAPELGLQV